MPAIMGCIFLFVLWIKYEITKTKHTSAKSSEDFWKREMEANYTRNSDVSNLPYIKIPEELLLTSTSNDNELQQLQATLVRLSQKPILNLSGLSNTELKLRYGAGKFTYMSECDSNYTILIRTLNDLGEYSLKLGDFKTAEKYLLYSLECNSELSQSYLLLADVYAKSKDTDNILNLIEKAKQLTTFNKDSLVSQLSNRLMSF